MATSTIMDELANGYFHDYGWSANGYFQMFGFASQWLLPHLWMD